MLLSVLLLFQTASSDTLHIRTIPAPPIPEAAVDSGRFGPAQARLRTRQGEALVWLLQSKDTFFVAARITDSTRHWGDEFVLSIDTQGDGGLSPRHDDFQWSFRRVADSSVIFRGRSGRWEPPKGDPDWRLGHSRSGGGWEVSGVDGAKTWGLLLRLDPVWLKGSNGSSPRLAVRIYDNDPPGWFAWPLPRGTPQATSVEQTPDLWAPVRSDAP
jgi:hypothetical protein